jgi:putative oxidoreductase
MSDDGITNGIRAAPATTCRGRAANFALWVLQAVLALMFVLSGFAKVGGDAAMVEMFATIGIGQWFRSLGGALEIAGAVGVLVPRLSGLAALGLVCLMVGATLTNVFVLGTSPLLPIALMLVSVLVAWGRWPQTSTRLARFKS